jgi:hypothetical protein
MQYRSVVHGLARELSGTADVVNVDMTTAGGRVIARTYGVTYTPAFVALDAEGALRHTVLPDYLMAAPTPAFRILDANGRVLRRVGRLDARMLADLARPALT